MKHGTIGGYTNHMCRCPGCTKAHRDYCREYQREYRKRNKAKLLAQQAVGDE